jgi:hypothetical protein
VHLATHRHHPKAPGIRASLKHQQKSQAVTAYKEFPARQHFLLGQDGWEEIADFALAWALNPVGGEL